jgi:hypothetical protein
VTVVIDAPAAIPDAPDGVTATNNANRTATVRWNDNSDNEDSFQIERQKRNNKGAWVGTTFFTTGANVESFTDNSGIGTFRYRVRARNSAGDSPWSAYAEVTVTRR